MELTKLLAIILWLQDIVPMILIIRAHGWTVKLVPDPLRRVLIADENDRVEVIHRTLYEDIEHGLKERHSIIMVCPCSTSWDNRKWTYVQCFTSSQCFFRPTHQTHLLYCTCAQRSVAREYCRSLVEELHEVQPTKGNQVQEGF